jgi:protein SCO1/2
MKLLPRLFPGLLACLALSCRPHAPQAVSTLTGSSTNLRVFMVKGVVKEVKPDGTSALIKHEAIPDYMEAMTMPFNVKAPKELAGIQAGDEISFRLLVAEDESWIDQVIKRGKPARESAPSPPPPSSPVPSTPGRHPLLDYKFTNELGQAVSLNDFQGQALAYTFFFTRCPIPDFCPRLSKNFQEASQKLSALPQAPTNWHLLSISFDTQFDTPAVLSAYARQYHYDANHWSFLTGPPDKIAELAGLSDLKFDRDGALFNHGFRTLVIDAAGRLQMSYPIGGNLSDSLVADLLKAAAATNQ